jgi:hypothetical protein
LKVKKQRAEWSPTKEAFLIKKFGSMISGREEIQAPIVRATPGAAHYLFVTCHFTQKQVMDKLQVMKKKFLYK